jgi:rhomboid protease GluP
MPILFKDRFPYRLETLGTAWGPLIFSGQWWRLFTCSFVHFDLLHVSSNMMGLWIFGVRVEREFGKWVFLLFYVMSGIAVSLGVLALRPDVASYGASGAVLSLGGGILAAYATRLRTVPRRTKIKLALLVLYFLAVVFREVARQDLYLPHTIGLLTGTILGWILVSAASKPKRQYEVFAGLAALLVSAAVLIGRYHR